MNNQNIFLELVVNLRFASRLHMGGGHGSGIIDGYVVRDAFKQPYIPGSAIKGTLRQSMSALYRANGGQCSYTHVNDCCDCIVCGLFGIGGNQKGMLYFDNLCLGTEDVNIHTKIRLDRFRGVVEDGAVYSTETLYTAAEYWRAHITGFLHTETHEKQIVLLYAGLMMLNGLGAMKSTGLGAIEEIKVQCKMDGHDIEEKMIEKWRDAHWTSYAS